MRWTFTATFEHQFTKCNSCAILVVLLQRAVRQCVNKGKS